MTKAAKKSPTEGSRTGDGKDNESQISNKSPLLSDVPSFNIDAVEDKRRSSSWTFWRESGERHNSLDGSLNVSRDVSPGLNNENIRKKASNSSLRGTNNDDSWWRRGSRSELADEAVETIEEDLPNKNDIVKDMITSNDKRPSWTFWNSSNGEAGPQAPQQTNIIFKTEDAVLFKSNEPGEVKYKEDQVKQNFILPGFDSIPYYSASQSILTNFSKLTNRLRITNNPIQHLHRTPQQSFKKVLIIGVHGFFPTKMIRPLIGTPTGTSLRFANEAEKAVLRYCERNGMKNVSIQKIALEKEGKVLDRVDFFYDILVKWIEEIQRSDFIFIAAHSQGCPVSIMLLAKLISNGHIDSSKKIGILAMAGINNGPFFGIDQKLLIKFYSTIENESMMELFEFQNLNSLLSRRFIESFRIIVQNNVKICFIGSIDDQLVPLYSSNCSHIRHPNIFRSTYIDHSSNTPAFLKTLVSISNNLLNRGLTDHGIIKEISTSLAGPLTGGGHSKIYSDGEVYDLGIQFALNTTNIHNQAVKVKEFDVSRLGKNPFHLPWCLRGLIYEDSYVLGDKEGINKLFDEFESWKPESKVLRDIKYRLNGIRAKL